MSFDSVSFWLLFPAAFAAWWLLPWRAAKASALVFSLVFYGWWNPWYLPLIVASSVVDFVAARRIAVLRRDRPRSARLWVSLSLGTNLGLLAAFKYGAFALENAGVVYSAFTGHPFEYAVPWIVPVGISFYTFQTLSYTLDVYRGRLEPTRSFLDFFLYVAFYPQLVAGPIVRARGLLPQFEQRPRTSPWRFQHGVYLCVWGLFLKMVVADNLAPEVDRLMAIAGGEPEKLTPAAAWLGMGYFGVEIFADFAGYSAIAIGLAALLGLRFPVNFVYPLLARGPAEFWSRWHVTLSTWFRDYVYIPLGGSRDGPWRTTFNLFLTMVVSGLWHGAAWGMLVWGALHGAALCVERAVLGARAPRPGDGAPGGPLVLVRRLIAIAGFQAFVLVAWSYFRAPSLEVAQTIVGAMLLGPFEGGLGFDSLGVPRHLILVVPVVLMHLRRLAREWGGWRETSSERALACRGHGPSCSSPFDVTTRRTSSTSSSSP